MLVYLDVLWCLLLLFFYYQLLPTVTQDARVVKEFVKLTDVVFAGGDGLDLMPNISHLELTKIE